MTDIGSNIRSLRKEIPETVKIVAVSKTKPVEDILAAYKAGQKIFGENRGHELISKVPLLPPDIEWHFIGHLQSNKVKQIVPLVSMIHSADSQGLLDVINRESAKAGKVTDCLLQFHIAREETKSGFTFNEALSLLESGMIRQMKNIRICGVMGMATFTNDSVQVRSEFRNLKNYFNELKERYFRSESFFREISMGMSGDFRIALEEGSTIVRIGSLIFGER